MNTTVHVPTALDWRAIVSGAGATLAIGIALGALLGMWMQDHPLGYGTVQALSIVVGLLADVVGGALAGVLAKRRGALHGAMAMVLASAFGLVASLVLMSRAGQLDVFLSLSYWMWWLLTALLGLGVGALAGLVAARIAAAKSAP